MGASFSASKFLNMFNINMLGFFIFIFVRLLYSLYNKNNGSDANLKLFIMIMFKLNIIIYYCLLKNLKSNNRFNHENHSENKPR